jgi:hypothetical protein
MASDVCGPASIHLATPWCGRWSRSPECKPRHTTLFAALDRSLAEWITDSATSETLVEILSDLVLQTPKDSGYSQCQQSLHPQEPAGIRFLEGCR